MVSRLPFIPTETEIDQLIAGCRKKTSTLLQLLKETGMRIGEASRIRWEDIDFLSSTIRITPEKGSNPRVFKLSGRLISMLQSLKPSPRKQVFGDLKSTRRLYYKARKSAARKLQNPRIIQITFHTFRHWKATMEYAKTKDILHVMKVLGHKNIRNTLTYVQLEEAIFSKKDEEYTCKAAETVKEAGELIELGFEYVCDIGSIKLFRKRK